MDTKLCLLLWNRSETDGTSEQSTEGIFRGVEDEVTRTGGNFIMKGITLHPVYLDYQITKKKSWMGHASHTEERYTAQTMWIWLLHETDHWEKLDAIISCIQPQCMHGCS